MSTENSNPIAAANEAAVESQQTQQPEYVFLTTEEIKSFSDELIADKIKEIGTIANTIGEEFKSKLYPINIGTPKTLKGLLSFLEHDAKWTHRNVPHLVAVYHGLKDALKEGVDENGNIFAKSLVIENVYQMLLAVEGVGYFNAKKYLTILTESGGAISESMRLLHDEQQLFTNYHTDLAALDTEQMARLQGIEVAPDASTSPETQNSNN